MTANAVPLVGRTLSRTSQRPAMPTTGNALGIRAGRALVQSEREAAHVHVEHADGHLDVRPLARVCPPSRTATVIVPVRSAWFGRQVERHAVAAGRKHDVHRAGPDLEVAAPAGRSRRRRDERGGEGCCDERRALHALTTIEPRM